MNTPTKTQALLQAFSGTQADLEAFIDRIPNDEEYKAYKAAHPERDSEWDNMTREQKTEHLVNLIMQLAEQEEQRQEREQQEQHKQLRNLLRKQSMPAGEIWDTITDYCHREQEHPEFKDPKANEMMLLLDMFEYGKICGIRAERAKRKGEQV